jgi:hypothetical protein
VPARSKATYPVRYRPAAPGREEASLVLSNASTGDEYKYTLVVPRTAHANARGTIARASARDTHSIAGEATQPPSTPPHPPLHSKLLSLACAISWFACLGSHVRDELPIISNALACIKASWS